jgi:hypothetical protein
MQDIGLNDEVLLDELRWQITVGNDPAHLGCRENHGIRSLALKEAAHCLAIDQVELSPGPEQQGLKASRQEPACDRRAD